MLLDLRRHKADPGPLHIYIGSMEWAPTLKFLLTCISEDLSWSEKYNIGGPLSENTQKKQGGGQLLVTYCSTIKSVSACSMMFGMLAAQRQTESKAIN